MTTLKKRSLITMFVLMAGSLSHAQVAINTDGSQADGSAMLEVTSTDKGFLPPRLTTAQRDAIGSPATGLTIFNTEYNCLQWYNGIGWYDLCEGGVTPGPEPDCNTPGFIAPFLTADETAIVDVTNPVTGKTWMDRNLGAMTDATYSEDCYAYGNLYQWGRASDGHEDRTSPNYNSGLANTALPNAGNAWDGEFITNSSSPYDWLTPQDDNLWQGTSGTNNPCPAGYRLPTTAEWEAERLSWTGGNNAAGAYGSPLKLPAAGLRFYFNGGFAGVDSDGYYWSSTVDGIYSRILFFSGDNAYMNSNRRAYGLSVRCIKD